MSLEIDDILDRSPSIPVLVIDDPDAALPLAGALIRGGLSVLEVTLRTPAAGQAALDIKAAFPEALVGIGTVTTPDDLEWVLGSGLHFGVSPGMSVELLKSARQTALPFLPGAATVSEMMTLRELGFRAIKFFPAEACGGVSFLASVSAVLPEVVFCPTGGVHQDNLQDYLSLPNVRSLGGSWIAPPALIREGKWAEIEHRAGDAITKAGRIRGKA